MKQRNAHNTNFFLHLFSIAGSIVLSCLSPINPAFSQIASDGTLSTNVTTGDNLNFTINGGNRAGNNLFHSFHDFSVPTNGSAFFNNAGEIQNIFSRVTGSSISNIDGLIRANGVANLFLLNPNGIIFGPNAKLNIGGSFLASTARSLVFADGTVFSATPSDQSTPLLTLNVPIGLQFGPSSSAILVQGSSLQVQSGKTLALVGGDITLTGSNLTATRGRIELGAVAGNSRVNLSSVPSGWALNYTDVPNFQDIQLSQKAVVDTSGEGGGDIQVQARHLRLTDGSQIRANTVGSAPAGNLTVTTSESVEVIGRLADGTPSALQARVEAGATGAGGNVTVITRRLRVEGGARIATSSLTQEPANAGNLTVQATDAVEVLGVGVVQLPGGETQQQPSALSTLTTGGW